MGRRTGIISIIATALLTFSASQLLADEKPIGTAIADVPIFDAHMHYKRPAWESYPVATVIELMDRNGVAMALVSSTPDDGTIRLWEYAPGRVVPALRPYHGQAGSGNWTKAKGMEAYIQDRLSRYSHEAIGEFHIHQLDPDDRPLLVAITKMAKARDIPLQIHTGAEQVRYVFDIDPRVKIIWAHAGMSEPAQVVGEMFDRYPTLYADTSYRERDILSLKNTIAEDWQRVIDRHADRLMIGSDTWINDQWDDYDGIMAINRRWLALLPRATAEKIAYGNAARLFGRKISNRQLGTR